MNINGAIITETVINEIITMQDPVNSSIAYHKEDISELVDFLISIRQYIDLDKQILDHCEALKHIRKTLESFQVV